MPAKNVIKQYVENGYYHVYNRGIDKREIFLEEKDCVMFLHFLKLYLAPPIMLKADKKLLPSMLHKINDLNLHAEVILLSFALMPNHFHLQIKQITKNGVEKLMRRVLTSYAGYFNRKYNRRGTLFESAYKAVTIEAESQHLYLSSYIHRNPMKLINSKFDFIQFSSYPYYLGEKQTPWINPNEILAFFKSAKNKTLLDYLSYQSFVESFLENPENILKELIIENE